MPQPCYQTRTGILLHILLALGCIHQSLVDKYNQRKGKHIEDHTSSAYMPGKMYGIYSFLATTMINNN